MTIAIRCDLCSAKFEVDDGRAGHRVQCPHCREWSRALAADPRGQHGDGGVGRAAAMIRFHCGCGKKIGVAGHLAGRRGRCPDCGAHFTVPAASTHPPPPSRVMRQDPTDFNVSMDDGPEPPSHPVPTASLACPACGAELPDGAKFCPSCGSSAPAPQSADPQRRPSPLPSAMRRHPHRSPRGLVSTIQPAADRILPFIPDARARVGALAGGIAVIGIVIVLALAGGQSPKEREARAKVEQAKAAVARGDVDGALALLHDAEALDPALAPSVAPLRASTEEQKRRAEAKEQHDRRLRAEMKIISAKSAAASGDDQRAQDLLRQAEAECPSVLDQINAARVDITATLERAAREREARARIEGAKAALAAGDFRRAQALLAEAAAVPSLKAEVDPLQEKARALAKEWVQRSVESASKLIEAGDLDNANELLKGTEAACPDLAQEILALREEMDAVRARKAGEKADEARSEEGRRAAAERAEAAKAAEQYDVLSALPGSVEFAYDRAIRMSSCGILKQLTFHKSGSVEAHYRNDTDQRVKPDVLVWVLNKDGVILWGGEDSWLVDSLEPGQEDDKEWSYQFAIDPRFAFSQWARRPGAWDLRPRYVLAVGSKYALEKLVKRVEQQVTALAQSATPAPDEGYTVSSALPEVVDFAFDTQIPMPSSGIVKRVIFSSQPYVDAHYLNDTEQRVKPDVIVWVLNREGVVIWEGEDSWVADAMDPEQEYKKSWNYALQINPTFAFSRWAREPGGWDLKPAHIMAVGSKYAFDQLVSRVVKKVESLNRGGK